MVCINTLKIYFNNIYVKKEYFVKNRWDKMNNNIQIYVILDYVIAKVYWLNNVSFYDEV